MAYIGKEPAQVKRDLADKNTFTGDGSTTTFDLTPVAFDKVNLNTSSNFSLVYGDPPLGIPSFVWGLCCGFAGIGIVYFTTEDTDQTKLALYGCMTTTIVYVILYFVGAVAALGY